ncbi:MAG: GreA/GreB family elongation factor [Cyclobacteriaceae bacterium]|nr:GreA/GreB family elongation factor [Cyclobacteriaceae bacterium]
MKYGKLIIARSEFRLISEILINVFSKDIVHKACYEKLREELSTAEIIDDDKMPNDVVRLYSWIDVKTPFGLIQDYQLVMPKDSNQLQKKLSILTPMGSALIGYAAGDMVTWSFPAGEKQITIKNVRQIGSGSFKPGMKSKV